MQTRHRAAATALLLTATAGLAAAGGGTAQASGSHTDHRATNKLVITIKTKAGGVKLSDSRFRPGNTVFRVKNAGGKGLIQVLRLRPGYTLDQAFADFQAGFGGSPDVKAIRRVDRNVVFYGGMPTPGKPSKPARKWAVNLGKASTYYAVNLDAGTLAPFKVKGTTQRRAMPAQDGFVNAKISKNPSGNTFKAGKHNAASGWMSTTNRAKEPHFVDLQQVKKGTTNADISQWFKGGPNPTVKGGAKSGTGVISPGHRFLWSYNLTKGRFVAMCFWPSKIDGTPHAIMGMHTVFNLY
jgi:hypothetical protein